MQKVTVLRKYTGCYWRRSCHKTTPGNLILSHLRQQNWETHFWVTGQPPEDRATVLWVSRRGKPPQPSHSSHRTHSPEGKKQEGLRARCRGVSVAPLTASGVANVLHPVVPATPATLTSLPLRGPCCRPEPPNQGSREGCWKAGVSCLLQVTLSKLSHSPSGLWNWNRDLTRLSGSFL